MMNRDQSRNPFSTLIKRPMLASSNGASTSSNIQNGLGRNWNIASSSETAVSAFSPPLNNEMLINGLPGGEVIISTPASSTSTPSSRTISAWPPPNACRYNTWKLIRICSSVSRNNRRLSALMRCIILSSVSLAFVRSVS